ncbi:YhgE/Pip domain-containing protein [Nocardia sp. NPDC004123]
MRLIKGSRVAAAAMVLVLVVPTLLSALYMWILWDPTNYLSEIPVAVASDDAGGTSDGQRENLGAAILDNLTAGRRLDFHRVDGAEAIEGLRQNRYTFSVVIPSDFTSLGAGLADASTGAGQLNGGTQQLADPHSSRSPISPRWRSPAAQLSDATSLCTTECSGCP